MLCPFASLAQGHSAQAPRGTRGAPSRSWWKPQHLEFALQNHQILQRLNYQLSDYIRLYLTISLSQVSCTCSTLFHHLQMLFPLKASLIPLKPSFFSGTSQDVPRQDSTRRGSRPSFQASPIDAGILSSGRCERVEALLLHLAAPKGADEFWRSEAPWLMVHMCLIYC